jgi:hypothetical protein
MMRKLESRVNQISWYLVGWTFLWVAMAGGLIAVGVLVGRIPNYGELVVLPGTVLNTMGGVISPTDPNSHNIRTGSSIIGFCAVQSYPIYWMISCQMVGSVKWDLASTSTSFDMPDLIPESMAPDQQFGFNVVATPSVVPAFTGVSYMMHFTFGTGANKRGIKMDARDSTSVPTSDWDLQQIFFFYIKLKP